MAEEYLLRTNGEVPPRASLTGRLIGVLGIKVRLLVKLEDSKEGNLHPAQMALVAAAVVVSTLWQAPPIEVREDRAQAAASRWEAAAVERYGKRPVADSVVVALLTVLPDEDLEERWSSAAPAGLVVASSCNELSRSLHFPQEPQEAPSSVYFVGALVPTKHLLRIRRGSHLDCWVPTSSGMIRRLVRMTALKMDPTPCTVHPRLAWVVGIRAHSVFPLVAVCAFLASRFPHLSLIV